MNSDPIRRTAQRLLASGAIASLRSPAGRFVLAYLRPLRWRLLRIAALALVQSGTEGVRMVLLLAVLHLVLGGQTGQVRSSVLGLPLSLPIPPVWLLPVSLLAVVILEVLDWIRKHLSACAQRDFVERLRADSMALLLRQPLRYFTATQAGASGYLITSQVGRFSLFLPLASDLVGHAGTLLVLAALLSWMQPAWTAGLLVAVAALWLGIRPLHRRLYQLGLDIAAGSAAAAAIVQDAIRGIRLVKVSRAEAWETDRATQAARGVAEQQVRATGVRNCAAGLHRAVLFALILAVALLAAHQGVGVQAMAFLLLLARAVPIVATVGDARMQVASAWGHVLQIAAFAETGPTPEPDVGIQNRRPGLCAIDLVASYGTHRVLDRVTVGFRASLPTALVGLTGSGKSTLLDILAGVREPEGGGRVLLLPDPESERPPILYLTQESILMYGTVAENIAYPGQPLPGRDLVGHGMPLDRHVGESGSALSGGQRQLVALARMARSDAPIRLLDEPTAALDAEVEREWIDRILGGGLTRAVVLSTHKLAVARRFPRIVVLHRGRIEAEGTHEELIEQDGLYARLWRLQEVA